MEFAFRIMVLGCISLDAANRELTKLLAPISFLTPETRAALLSGGTLTTLHFTPFGELMAGSMRFPEHTIRLEQIYVPDPKEDVVETHHIFHIQEGRVLWEFQGTELELRRAMLRLYPGNSHRKWLTDLTTKLPLVHEFQLMYQEATCWMRNNRGFHSYEQCWFFTVRNEDMIRHGAVNLSMEPMAREWSRHLGAGAFRVNPLMFTLPGVYEKEESVRRLVSNAWGR